MEVNHLINYVNKDGKVIVNHLVNDYLIKSEDDLTTLINLKCAPGTEAYLADGSKIWELDTNYEWQLKTTGTAAEEGLSGVMVVHDRLINADDAEYRFDKTWNEIRTAMTAGIPVIIIADIMPWSYGLPVRCYYVLECGDDEGTSYWINGFSHTGLVDKPFKIYCWTTDSADGYPQLLVDAG